MRQNWLAHVRPTSTERETRTSISLLQFDEASLEVSKEIDNDQRFDQELFTEFTEMLKITLVVENDTTVHDVHTYTVAFSLLFLSSDTEAHSA